MRVKTLEQKLEKHLGLEMSQTLLIDERMRGEIVATVSKVEAIMKKITATATSILEESKSFKDKFIKSLSAELEQVFPTEGSGTSKRKECGQ